MKKYLLILLFISHLGNAQYNLFARQNFAKSASAPTYNTYIGGVSATISTASALATRLGISVGNISNFTIVGSDIKCKITGSYAIPANAFDGYTTLTYFRDSGNLVTSIGSESFFGCTNLEEELIFNSVTSVAYNAFTNCNKLPSLILPLCTSVGSVALRNCFYLKQLYIPICTNYGGTSGNDGIFNVPVAGCIIYTNTVLATNNGGSPDGDLAYATTNGSTVRYVANFTEPLTPTSTAISTLNATSIQLVDAGGSANTVDYFEVTLNGVFYGNVTPNGYIIGLQPSTTYSIILKAVDIYYNKSANSSSLSASTNTTDISYPSGNILAYYQMEGNVNDSAGANNGTATAITYASGLTGQAGVFNGTTSNVLAQYSTFAISGTSNFSMSVLINLSSFPSSGNVYAITAIQQFSSPGTHDKAIRVTSSGQATFYAYDGALKSAISFPNELKLNTNYVLTGVYNGSILNIYINGVLKGTMSASSTYAETSPTLAISLISGTTTAVNGKVDEVTVWNTALTDSQVIGVSSKILSGQHL